MRTSIRPALTISAIAVLAAAASAAPPAWSEQFAATGGIGRGQFEDGVVCFLARDTPVGPRLYIGGEFTSANGAHHRSITSFDGAAFFPVHGLVSEFNAERVAALTPFPIDGAPRIVVAGSFDAPTTLQGLGYLDETDTLRTFPASPTTSHTWYGGAFAWSSPSGPELILSTSLTPLESDYIYRYTSAGFGLMSPGVITITTAFAVVDGAAGSSPELFIGVPMSGGNFNDRITRWNGSTLTSVSSGPFGWVNALCIHDDGSGRGPELYAGGNGLTRLRDGAWQSIAGAPLNIQTMLSFDDGSGRALYIAGQFTTVASTPMTNIARLRADGTWQPLGAGLAGGVVRTLAAFDEDGPGPRPAALYAGGAFTTAGGFISPGIARWGATFCPADINADDAVSVQDIFDFLAAYFATTAPADFNHSGAITIQDIFDFLSAYFAAC